MAAEGVTAKRYLASAELAGMVGMKEDYACMNKVCSKAGYVASGNDSKYSLSSVPVFIG